DVQASPVGPPDDCRFVVVFRDVTERRQAETALRESAGRAAFRAALADALRPLTDPAEVKAAATRLLGLHLGASRVHYGEIDDEAFVIDDQDYTDGSPSLTGRFRMENFNPALVGAHGAGQIVVTPDIANAVELSDADREAYAAAGVASQVCVPLVRGSRLVAVLAVHQNVPRAWTAAEASLVEETAERTWTAVERARAEGALSESEAKLRLLVESATDYAIFTTDLDRRVTTWNAGAQALFGYTEDEIVGRPADVLFTPEDRAAGVPEWEAATALAEGRAPDDRWHLRKDGTRFYVNGVVAPLRDGRGFVKIARDLTARRVADAALAESEERYRTLFATMSEGFALCEVVVGEDGRPADYRFLDVNPAFEASTGITTEQATGATARAVIPGLEDLWVETFGRVAMDREPARFENRVEALNRWFEVYAFPTGADDSGLFAVVFSDVSERKRAEAEVQALNETLEARVEERTREVRTLAARLTLAEQAERERIALVLHDDLQQQHHGLAMILTLARDAPDKPAALLGRALEILDSAVRTTRTLVSEMSPTVLQSDQFVDLLGW
ncbi:MAG TPA: PAS domain S-box protein, partial [Rubricoccaceae bacterium]